MNKVTTINLNGRAYQLEEAGYAALREYLDKAEAKLHDNPDKDEIMSDFEQAIAEKFDSYLSGHKNVVSAVEVEAIIAKMGPVEATTGASESNSSEHAGAGAAAAGTASSAGAPKRLYRIPPGEWIVGVCTGLAAYFNMDVTLIRVIFIVLTVLTHGFGILLYIVLAIVVPVAHTEEQMAQARGTKPFNAHDFIEQAKTRYAEFQKTHPHAPPAPQDPTDKQAWRDWKQEMKDWKRNMKAEMRQEKQAERAERRAERHQHGWQNQPWQNRSWQDHEGAGAGFFRFLMTLIMICLTVLFAFTLVLFLHHGTIFGVAVATGTPWWISVIFICALFYVVAVPFKLLKKNARPQHWGNYSFFNDVVQSIFFIFALYLVILLGSHLFPIVNEAWQNTTSYVLNGVKK